MDGFRCITHRIHGPGIYTYIFSMDRDSYTGTRPQWEIRMGQKILKVLDPVEVLTERGRVDQLLVLGMGDLQPLMTGILISWGPINPNPDLG